jgi:hypothetical protein
MEQVLILDKVSHVLIQFIYKYYMNYTIDIQS